MDAQMGRIESATILSELINDIAIELRNYLTLDYDMLFFKTKGGRVVIVDSDTDSMAIKYQFNDNIWHYITIQTPDIIEELRKIMEYN